MPGQCTWGTPHPAIDPETFGRAPRTDLGDAIALYAKEAKNRKAREEREARQQKAERKQVASHLEALAEEAGERFRKRDLLLPKIRIAHAAARKDPDSGPLAELMTLPDYLRTPLLQRLKHLQKKQEAAEAAGKSSRPASRYIRSKLALLLRRITLTNSRFLTQQYQIIAVRERLDELLHLPHLNKRRIQTLATLTAGAFSGEFDRQYTRPDIEQTPMQALAIYQRLGYMALSLHITPPRWEALRLDKNRRNPIDMDKLPGAIARLMCAEYWKRKLWRLRCRWREEQLRAAGQVSRQVSPYISRDALSAFREQRRRLREFLKSHELVSEDGFTIDLEDVYYASASSPKHRRFEMMTTMKGIEMIAEERGDVPTFITVTCPSRFHVTTEDGHPNPKWDGSTTRDSSNYLVDRFFSAVRKKLKRQGLFWYGIRVAEPHHDGTVHWHMMMFTRPEERETIEEIVRDIAIRDDREELGDDITPRFKSEIITAEKGSPTGYIATYIGKNIDRGAVKGNDPKTGEPRKDNESGKDMAETVENAIGWAGLHGVRQFQFFGIPSRQVWRELRRLACQMTRQKDGPQRLPDPAMDNVLACADAGDFAAYIMAQGGVLIPRKDYVVRTAYDIADRENDYGETPIQIYGIYSPILGAASRICTHPDTWKLVKKAAPTTSPAAQPRESVDVPGGPAAP
ncbi:replication endonuclease [Edwardsiella tarda]